MVHQLEGFRCDASYRQDDDYSENTANRGAESSSGSSEPPREPSIRRFHREDLLFGKLDLNNRIPFIEAIVMVRGSFQELPEFASRIDAVCRCSIQDEGPSFLWSR